MVSFAPAEKAPTGKPLKVGSPHDPAEREADHIADILTAPEEPALPVCAACAAGGAQCPACGGGGVLRRTLVGDGEGGSVIVDSASPPGIKARNKPEQALSTQDRRTSGLRLAVESWPGRAAADENNALPLSPPSSVHSVLATPGHPLPAESRGFFEQRLGKDLNHIRVHTDAAAQRSAREIAAIAYTAGPHIVFGSGHYQPSTTQGQHLLAHELAHTMQQGAETMIQRQRDLAPHGRTGAGDVHGVDFIGSCDLRNGTLAYALEPEAGLVNVHIEFTPSPALAATGQMISFLQTVQTFSRPHWYGPEYIDPKRVDSLSTDTDPFYGAEWNRGTGNWGDEPTMGQARGGSGSRPFTAQTGSAVINDSPMLNVMEWKEFESVAVVLETGEPLASLYWRIQRWHAGFFHEGSSTIVRYANCREGAPADLQSLVNYYYQHTWTFIDGFAINLADPPATCAQGLQPIIDALHRNPTRRILIGGAATRDETNPDALSQVRAERVRDYLVTQGIEAHRITVESYGIRWARVPISDPRSPNANRRVQIRFLS